MPAPESELALRRWTAVEVRDQLLDELRPTPRYECVDGELLVTPAPTWTHQYGVGDMFVLLRRYTEGTGVGVTMVAPADIELAADTLLQPDVFVVPFLEDGRPPRQWSDVRRLLLAVEVLSPSTARYDRIRKRRFHQRAGTPEYWVVDPEIRAIERTRAGAAGVEMLDTTLTWLPEGAATPFALDVEAYFAGMLDR